MADNYSKQKTDLDDPAPFAVTVVANNTSNLTSISRALYIGTTGNVNVEMTGSATNTLFVAVPAGSFLPIRVNKVLFTGTTASDIINLY